MLYHPLYFFSSDLELQQPPQAGAPSHNESQSKPNGSASRKIRRKQTFSRAGGASTFVTHLETTEDEVHVTILCVRAVMNNSGGFNIVFNDAQAINAICMALTHRSRRLETLNGLSDDVGNADREFCS